jgi:hypothetical protein
MKDCIPIVSGSVQYAGLTMIEITLNFMLFGIYFVIIGLSWWIPVIVFVQIILNIVYVTVIKKFEDNIIGILTINRRIPNIICGYFSTLPIREFRGASKTIAPFGEQDSNN